MRNNHTMKQRFMQCFWCLLLFMVSSPLLGQTFSTKHSFAIKGEYSIGERHNMTSFGIGFLNPSILNGGPCNSFPLGTHGPSLNFDFDKFRGASVYGPRLSYEYTLMFIGAKLNCAYLRSWQRNMLVFTPEVGLSVLGYLYVFYGYNFIDNDLAGYGGHKITIGVNWIPFVRYTD
jgi:hypothetical protein